MDILDALTVLLITSHFFLRIAALFLYRRWLTLLQDRHPHAVYTHLRVGMVVMPLLQYLTLMLLMHIFMLILPHPFSYYLTLAVWFLLECIRILSIAMALGRVEGGCVRFGNLFSRLEGPPVPGESTESAQ